MIEKLKEIEAEGGMGNRSTPSRSWGGMGATPSSLEFLEGGGGGYASGGGVVPLHPPLPWRGVPPLPLFPPNAKNRLSVGGSMRNTATTSVRQGGGYPHPPME